MDYAYQCALVLKMAISLLLFFHFLFTKYTSYTNYLSHCYRKIPDKSNLRKVGFFFPFLCLVFCFAVSFMGYSLLRYRKATAGHIMFTLRREKEINTDVQLPAFLFYSCHGIVLPPLGWVFQSQLTNFISQRHAKNLVF